MLSIYLQNCPSFFLHFIAEVAVLFTDISTFDIIQEHNYKMALRKYSKAMRYLDVCLEKEEIFRCLLGKRRNK